MLFVSSLVYLSTSLLGGYHQIPTTNDYVKAAKGLVDPMLDVLFPEIKNVDGITVDSAYSQVVAGTNIKLDCKYGYVEFIVKIFFPLRKKPYVTRIKGKSSDKQLVGGFKWKEITDAKPLLQTIKEKHNSQFDSNLKLVHTLREKVLRGVKYSHVIYNDDNGKFYSMILAERPSDKIEVEYHKMV